MAEVYNIPIAPVTSLEALAKSVELNITIVSLIDARNNQVYCGIFDKNINLKEEYIVDDINIVLDKVKKYENVTFVGNGSVLHRALIKQKINNPIFAEKNEQNSFYVGLKGYQKYKENKLETADTIAPLYLRKSRTG